MPDERVGHVRRGVVGRQRFCVALDLAQRVGQRVAQREAPLGVGVVDLDGLARHRAQHVAERDGQVVGQTMITYEWSDWRNGTFWWIQSVYIPPEACGRFWVVVSVKQMYPGHSNHVGNDLRLTGRLGCLAFHHDHPPVIGVGKRGEDQQGQAPEQH